MTVTRVAILVVGDEILSGDTEEANAGHMARALFERGVSLGRVVIVPDDRQEISEQLALLADAFDVVITCGGIGPTHDDVTMESVALAFGSQLTEHPDLLALLKKWKGEPLSESHRRLARVPAQAVLHWSDDNFPLVQVENVYVLPGVPRLLRSKLAQLLPRLAGEPIYQRQFRLHRDELSLAQSLRDLQVRFPEVSLGSYPYSDAPGRWAVRLVVKARDPEALERASDALLSALGDVEEI